LFRQKKTYAFDEGEWHLGKGFEKEKTSEFNVVAFDFGVKKKYFKNACI